MKICFLYWVMESLQNAKTARSVPPMEGDSRKRSGAADSRWHVLDYAVEEVEALVVVGFGGDELLENSQQARLWEEQRQDVNTLGLEGLNETRGWR